MNLFVVGCFAIFGFVQAETYVPGTPGAPWDPKHAEIIRNKIFHLWRTDIRRPNVRNFDLKKYPKGNKGFTDYLYEPDFRLSKVDCDTKEGQCKGVWEDPVRENAIAFTPVKAIRLAFHDAQPYVDGSGGVDGCINFEENVAENDVMQHSVAILEKLYMEKDYPNGVQKLPKSPKDLGISRADLWSFAGILALDEVSRRTRAYCDAFDQGPNQEFTCGDWSPCYAPFPKEFGDLFYTGRSDCQSKAKSHTLQYLAPLSEDSPHAVATGQQTADYFKDKFGLTPRESLALMGAHTVGQFSTFHTHLDYSWVRKESSRRTKIFNNEYYKTLALKPAHTKDKYCVGKIDGSPATREWHLFANVFEYYWRMPVKGQDWKQRPGERRFIWHTEVTRGPNCQALDEDGRFNGMQAPWFDYKEKQAYINGTIAELKQYAKEKGFIGDRAMYDYCCDQVAKGCRNEGTCDTKCNQQVQDRIRHLASDVGFYYKFDFDWDGIPIGCPGFKSVKDNNRWGWYYADRAPEPPMCPKQTMKEGLDSKGKPAGKKIWQTVEEYADDIHVWLKDFVSTWKKMSQNGNQNLIEGPKNLFTSRCCLHSEIKYEASGSKILKSIKKDNTLACQKACRFKSGCKWFTYDTVSNVCKLMNGKPKKAKAAPNNWLAGPPRCPKVMNECNAYNSI